VPKKAQYFFIALGFEGTFSAFLGWLTRFKLRHAIQEITTEGESWVVINRLTLNFMVISRN
jgi:hypothetical protein